MNKLIVFIVAMAASCGVYADLTVVSSLDGSTLTYTVSGATAVATERPVYLAWGETDGGTDWAKWEESQKVGTLAANATSMTFTLPARIKESCPMRVFLFSGTDGDNVWLDAIRADNDQYLNTGIKPNHQTACFADYKMADNVVQQRIFGIDGGITLQTYINGSKQWAYSYKDGAGDWQGLAIDVTATDRVQYLVDGYKNFLRLQYNGVDKKTVIGLSGTRTQEGTSPVGVFTHLASNGTKRYTNTANTHNSWTHGDLYGFYMKKGGKLVSSLKPRKKDGVACAYDGIQQKYLMSGTANAFLAVDPIGEVVDSGTDTDGNTVVFATAGAEPLAADKVTGEKNVRLDGGIVQMNRANDYTGYTWLSRGTLWMDEIINDSLGALGAKGPLVLGPGTLSWNGGTGVYNGDIVTKLDYLKNDKEGFSPATVFDVAEGGDLTLGGAFNNPRGAFVKTGKGTLRIPGGEGQTITLAANGGYVDALCLPALTFNANGDAPTKGYSGFCLAGGTLVLGEKGGTFNINGSASDVMIGTMTKDPVLNAGEQEDGNGVLEVRGGTVNINNWLGMGAKCGFATTTPNYIPESGIRVYGGKLVSKKALGMGRNKSAVPQKDADGNWIPQRTKTFVEVHGGTFEAWDDNGRVSPCDDAGADSRILVDGGKLFLRGTIKDGVPTTSAGFKIANCQECAATTPSRFDFTIAGSGIVESTDNYIVNARQNVTVDIVVKDGGTFRWNTLRKVNTKAGTTMNVLFDGGKTELRYAGYTTWIQSDIDTFKVGTRGMTFTVGTDANVGVRNNINKTLTAETTHEGEADQGVTITAGNATRLSGFRFMVPQAWAGPTRIAKWGICELAATGAFPAESAVTLEALGSLTITNAPQTFASFMIGDGSVGGEAALAIQKDCPITVRDAFETTTGTTLALSLYGTAGQMDFPADGAYDVLTVPLADLHQLKALVKTAVCANLPAEKGCVFSVEKGETTATLKATIGAPVDDAIVLQNTTGGEDDPITFEGPVAGVRSITTNPTATGGGLVDLGDALADYDGVLSVGSGTTKVSDLSFAEEFGDVLTLGRGTLWYTGTGETIAGLFVNPGSGASSVLKIDNDLTLTGITVGTGALMKKGAGDLVFKGNGDFYPGNVDNAFSRSEKDSVKPNGDSPTGSLKNLLVSEGRVVIGTQDDPADAPNVFISSTMGVGCRSTKEQDERRETAGELVLNNGLLDVPDYCYLGFYCGTPWTDPNGELQPKITVNGGVLNAKAIRMGHDGNGNMQTASPMLEVNGGEVNLSTYLEVAWNTYSQTTVFTPVNTVVVTGGVLRVKSDLNMGNQKNCPEGVLVVGGTGTLVVSNNLVVGKANEARLQKVFLEEGGTLQTGKTLQHTAGAPSEIYFRGGVWQPGVNRGANYSLRFESHNHAYVGKGGFKVDFAPEWEKGPDDSSYLEFGQKMERDPELAEGEEDGGLLFCGHTTAILREASSKATFTGPVVSTNGFIFGVDNRSDLFETKTFVVNEDGGLRASGDGMLFKDLTLGTAGGTKPITIDYCNNANFKALVAKEHVKVLSPVTVSFHRPGGACNTYTMREGTIDVLYYRPEDEANVPLEMFVANSRFPAYTMTYAKSDVTAEVSTKYAGMKRVTVTIALDPNAASDVWTNVTTGGAWEDAANWQGETTPDAVGALVRFEPATAAVIPVTVAKTPTAGRVTLNAADAAKGFALSGAPINLNHEDMFSAPSLTVASGTHVLANGLVTDDTFARSNETTANGGRTGAIALDVQTGAKLTVTGPVTTDPKRELFVNNPKRQGGGLTVLDGEIHTKEVRVESGTAEIADLAKLNGAALRIGPATVNLTGEDAETDSAIIADAGATNKTAVLRLANKLTLNGTITAGASGSFMKTGPGELVLNALGNNQLGGAASSNGWNNDTAWPANGDSLVQGNSSFCLDEGTVTFGRPGQHTAFGSNSDIFIGSQRRGWDYASDKVTLNMMGGTASARTMGIGHGMRRGATGDDLAYVEFNQYDGVFTNTSNVYIGYDLTKYDSHIQATMNLFGGEYRVGNYIRVGQTYNKTGAYEPLSKLNVFNGAKLTFAYTKNSDQHGNLYVPYAEGMDHLKAHLNRASDAIFTVGGTVENAYLVLVGQNGARGEVHLEEGGFLDCENIAHRTYADTAGAYYYHAFNVADGTAHVYFNGGVFAPRSKMDAEKDTKKDIQYNATFGNFTEAIVQAGGARISTENCAVERYTIAQELTHDATLGDVKDGGLEKLGAGTLALATPSTYTGDTVVRAGTLLVTKEAPAGAILPNSAVEVCEGATLAFESGTKATLTGLAIGPTAGTVSGALLGRGLKVYLPAGVKLGDKLALTVDGCVNPGRFGREQVYVNGVLDRRLGLELRADGLYLGDSKYGTMMIIR